MAQPQDASTPAKDSATVTDELAASQPPKKEEPEAASPDSRAQYGLSREGLEQEVGQVLGTLSSWWGGVKKQSATAISSIKADLDKTVTQAQADFEQLRTAKVEVVRKDPEQFAAEQAEEREKKREQKGESQGTQSESLLNRISSSTSQLQHTLTSTLAAAANTSALPNASDITTHIAESLKLSSAKENLQTSVKQAEKLAEEYLQKGDKLRKDAEKWMSEAVKVVPPDDGASGSGISWDGSDWYAIVSQPSVAPTPVNPTSTRPAAQTVRALAGSRKDALLARLREDKDLVLVDPVAPNTPAEQRERYGRWLANTWPIASKEAIAAEAGSAGSVRMAVVPEHMTDEQFWQRYLYIRDTIIEEDEKRQQLLKATEQTQQVDDFTWDDEPDEGILARASPPPTPKSSDNAKLPIEASLAATPSISPRDSEESYDVISDQAMNKAAGAKPNKDKTKDPGDDEDSDWE